MSRMRGASQNGLNDALVYLLLGLCNELQWPGILLNFKNRNTLVRGKSARPPQTVVGNMYLEASKESNNNKKKREESLKLDGEIAANNVFSLAIDSRVRLDDLVFPPLMAKYSSFIIPLILNGVGTSTRKCVRRARLEDATKLIDIPPSRLKSRLVRNLPYDRIRATSHDFWGWLHNVAIAVEMVRRWNNVFFLRSSCGTPKSKWSKILDLRPKPPAMHWRVSRYREEPRLNRRKECASNDNARAHSLHQSYFSKLYPLCEHSEEEERPLVWSSLVLSMFTQGGTTTQGIFSRPQNVGVVTISLLLARMLFNDFWNFARFGAMFDLVVLA